MKYLLFIVNICILGMLFGCSKSLDVVSDINNETNYSSFSQYTGPNMFVKGTLYSGTYFSGVYFPILISGGKLIFGKIFSVTIPEDITNKEYIIQKTPINPMPSEKMYFYNDDKNKSFSFSLGKFTYSDSPELDKSPCIVEYFDGYITKSEKIKKIQGRNIYIYYATLLVSAPDIEPFEVIDSQFCFIDSGMLYTFYASNYTHKYIDELIDSFTFLD